MTATDHPHAALIHSPRGWRGRSRPDAPVPCAPRQRSVQGVLALAVVGAVIALLAPPAAAVERVADGTFDAATCTFEACTSPWAQETDLRPIGPICSATQMPYCGYGGSGYVSWPNWVRLGADNNNPDSTRPTRSAVQQTVQIPATPATLTFYLRIIDQPGSFGTFVVSVGGTPVFSATDTTPGYVNYTPVRVDLSTFAGGARAVRFEGTTEAVQLARPAASASFDVDDVSVDAAGPPSTPGPGPAPGPGPGPGPAPGPGPGPRPGPDADTPFVSALSLSPSAFRAAHSGPSVTTSGGSRVSYTLSQGATVSFRVEQVRSGRRVGRSCVSPTTANRKRQRCTRYPTLSGSFTHQGAAGANTFRFSGRLRARKLGPGRYRLRAVATDASANTSVPKRSFFTILRSR